MNEIDLDIPARPDEEPLASLVKLVEKYGPDAVMEAMSIVELYADEPDNSEY